MTDTTEKDDIAGVPLLRRAVMLDRNFAVAYVKLGACYNNMGETALAAKNLRRAYELRERVSEHEKFKITSLYEIFVTGNLEAARSNLELWAHAYPHDDSPWSNLQMVFYNLGYLQEALAASQEALKRNPAAGTAYQNLAKSYLALNRLDEARTMAREARNRGAPRAASYLYQIDFLQHDAAGMEKEVAELAGKPGYEDIVLGLESDTAAYAGRFARARELTRRAVASARRAGEPEAAAAYLGWAALREALAGNLIPARRLPQAGLPLSHGRDVEAASAMALALAGDAGEARRLASDLARRFPEDTLVQVEYLPMVQACTALGIGHGAAEAARAIDALGVAARYELGGQEFDAPYLRGTAYLAARRGTAAAAEFQKLLAHNGVVVNWVTGALAHLGLGRAYALAGDNVKARTAYQDFLALWKDADPDLPVLKQAKAEHAKLANASGQASR